MITIVLLWLFATSAPAIATESLLPVTRLQHDVVFTQYSALSSSSELARRMLSPLTNVEIARAGLKSALQAQAIDLKDERFAVYVPVNMPPRGYGLLAFIPPWQDSHLPAGWAAVLDEKGIIFVTPARSGNAENVMDRRIPLALLGAFNIMQGYSIDPKRVYIGGFSGGSRVALRLALAYPDFFHGALLNAGSDPIGNREAILPPGELFFEFQRSSQLVFTTGSDDSWNMQHDLTSQDSLRKWCVFGTGLETMWRVGHDVATPYSLSHALAALDRPTDIDVAKFSACTQRTAMEMAIDLNKVHELIDHDEPRKARRALGALDARYGGLASSAIIALEQQIAHAEAEVQPSIGRPAPLY